VEVGKKRRGLSIPRFASFHRSFLIDLYKTSPERDKNPWHRIPDALLPNLLLPWAGDCGAVGFHEVDRKGVMCPASEVFRPKCKDPIEPLRPARGSVQTLVPRWNGIGKELLRPVKIPVESLFLSGEQPAAVAFYMMYTIDMITSMHIMARIWSRNQKVDARRCTPYAAQQAKASGTRHRQGKYGTARHSFQRCLTLFWQLLIRK
jgi:hypothetical protein